jgi:SAM-dependent methyltransferase
VHLLGALALAGGDRRSHASGLALGRFLAEGSGPKIAIGGGPTRVEAGISNLNVSLVGEVDLLGDAHRLPLAGESVGGFHCEAVLEHLESPHRAVAEMHRCLRPGGLVFSATPFLQPFHGYPSHYQNFTLVGHERLFRQAGFDLLDSGCCVGPAWATADLVRFVLREIWPAGAAGRILGAGAWLLSQPVRLLDRRLANSPRGALACSTTFVLARKGPA